uniref:Uncharacterized protein n=1 Tax=Anopheles dirus TaxID=7168 RepID=A0A182NJV2_9DIPT
MTPLPTTPERDGRSRTSDIQFLSGSILERPVNGGPKPSDRQPEKHSSSTPPSVTKQLQQLPSNSHVPSHSNPKLKMFKLLALPLFFAAVSAGYLGAPLAYSAPAYAHAPLAAAYHAPLAYHSPVVKTVAAPVAYAAPAYHAAPLVKAVAPVATSYANTYKVSVKAPVAYAAPAVVSHAPVAYAAPAYAAPAYAAPAYAHHAPLAYAHGYYH